MPGQPSGSTHHVDGRAYATAVAGHATGTSYTIPAFETGLVSTEYDSSTGAVATTTSPQKGGVPRETRVRNG